MDAFEAIVKKLRLPRHPRILDVGAGGFVGETTTRHLVRYFGGEITAIEIHQGRAERLQEAFQDKIKVICGDFTQYQWNDRFDLIVLDLDPLCMPAIFYAWLPGKVFRLLRPGGYTIAINLANWENAITPGSAIHYGCDLRLRFAPGDLMHGFLLTYWGALNVTEAVVRGKFARDPLYKVVSVMDKWVNDPKNIINYVCLQKRSWPMRMLCRLRNL
jgi:hypothetical protein